MAPRKKTAPISTPTIDVSQADVVKYKKNVIVAGMFLLLAFILLAWAMVVLYKVQNEKTMLKGLQGQTNNRAVNTITSSINDLESENQESETIDVPTIQNDKLNAQQTFINFVTQLEQGDFTNAYKNFDYAITNDSRLVYYLNPTRLGTLFSAIKGFSVSDVIEVETEKKSPNIFVFAFQMDYELVKTGELFTSQWKVFMRKKENGIFAINQILCESKGCSFHPFFNFEKFGIK